MIVERYTYGNLYRSGVKIHSLFIVNVLSVVTDYQTNATEGLQTCHWHVPFGILDFCP